MDENYFELAYLKMTIFVFAALVMHTCTSEPSCRQLSLIYTISLYLMFFFILRVQCFLCSTIMYFIYLMLTHIIASFLLGIGKQCKMQRLIRVSTVCLPHLT